MTENAFHIYMLDYYWVVAVIYTISGVYFLFLGRKFIKASVFVFGMLFTSMFMMFMVYHTFLSTVRHSWVFWTALCYSLALSPVGGYFTIKMKRVGAAMMCSWAGYSFGTLLCICWLNVSYGNKHVFWSVQMCIAAVVFGVSLVRQNEAIVICTSFIGAFLFIRGVSMFSGQVGNALFQLKLIESSLYFKLPSLNWTFIASVFLVWPIGALFQWR
jgi:hypothetical protein